MSDWDGNEYARVSGLRGRWRGTRSRPWPSPDPRTYSTSGAVMATSPGDRRRRAGRIRGGRGCRGCSQRPDSATTVAESGPVFVRADARHLPFRRHFDVVASFNALPWVRQQQQALEQIAAVVRPGGRILVQLVCAGWRTSLEAVAMELTRSAPWAGYFDGFEAPFVHVDPARFAEMAASAGFTVVNLSVAEHDWDFGSREVFENWCAVRSRAWTDRLPTRDRLRFIDEQVRNYERVAGRQGLFCSPRCVPN